MNTTECVVSGLSPFVSYLPSSTMAALQINTLFVVGKLTIY